MSTSAREKPQNNADIKRTRFFSAVSAHMQPTLFSTLRCLLLCIITGLILELTLFNISFYTNLRNQPIDLSLAQMQTEGFSRQPDGGLLITDQGAPKLTFQNLHQSIHSLNIRFSRYDAENNPVIATTVSLWATDEGNALPFHLGSRVIVSDNEASQYVTVHLAGKSTELSICPSVNHQDRLIVETVTLNPRVPFRFSILRALICALCLWVLYILIPKHGYYNTICNFKRPLQRTVICIVLVLQIAFITFCAFSNPVLMGDPEYHHIQYHRLAQALSHFDLHISERPSDELMEMENPYDMGLRSYNQVSYLWDTAYYNGYYFCYFGVVPVLLYHLPYYIITGQEFPTYIGVYISSIVTVLLAFWLVALLVKRFAMNRIPFLAYLIFSVLLSCGVVCLACYPSLYTLPIIQALLFSMLGLCLWLQAVKNGGINCVYAILGSLSVALVAGCRPQLLLGSFLSVPIFWSTVQKRLLFSRKSLGKTVLMLLPYFIVGAALMAYNYFRFGSPFDFGANYNLTGNDMTKRGFVFARIPLTLFVFFFQPPALRLVFPFWDCTNQISNYLGTTVSEPFFGGVFLTNVLSLASLFVFKVKHLFEQRKELWWFAVISVVTSFIIAIFDGQAAGLVERYTSDVIWLLLLAAILVLLAVFSSGSEYVCKSVCTFLCVAFIISMAYNLMMPFLPHGWNLSRYNPSLYYHWYYGMQFWL